VTEDPLGRVRDRVTRTGHNVILEQVAVHPIPQPYATLPTQETEPPTNQTGTRHRRHVDSEGHALRHTVRHSRWIGGENLLLMQRVVCSLLARHRPQRFLSYLCKGTSALAPYSRGVPGIMCQDVRSSL